MEQSDFKEKLILNVMSLSYEKCVKYDKDLPLMKRMIPLPEDLLPVIGRILSNVTKITTIGEKAEELKSLFIEKSLDELFYIQDDSNDITRLYMDKFIDNIESIKHTLEVIWDRIYKLTTSIIEDSGAINDLNKYKL